MKILFPIQKGVVVQPFGANADFYKSRFGISFHNGIDIVSHHGDSVLCCEDGLVVKTYNLKSGGSVTKGFGVYVLGDSIDENGCQNLWIFWHTMSNLQCSLGQKVKQGDVLAYEGDSGQVYVNNVPVPDENKGKPPFPGTHLHWGLIKVKKVKDSLNNVLANPNGSRYTTDDGFNLEIQDFNNGTRGCVDPMLNDIIYYDEWEQREIFLKTIEAGNMINVMIPSLPPEDARIVVFSFSNLIRSIWEWIVNGKK